MRLWLKKSAARPAGSRSARRRDPTRRRALLPRRRALLPPPSGPAAATLRGSRLELLADGRLQRARFRRLRTPTDPRHRPADLQLLLQVLHPGHFFSTPSLSTASSISPLASSKLYVSLCPWLVSAGTWYAGCEVLCSRPVLSGFRSSGWPSASVARSPPIGVTFPGKGGLFWPSSFQPSVAPRVSHGNSVAHRPKPSNSEVRISDVRAFPLDRILVIQACVARTRLRVDLRDSSGRHVRERFLRQVPHCSHGNSMAHQPHRTYFVLC